jgi:hypothetical protein
MPKGFLTEEEIRVVGLKVVGTVIPSDHHHQSAVGAAHLLQGVKRDVGAADNPADRLDRRVEHNFAATHLTPRTLTPKRPFQSQ